MKNLLTNKSLLGATTQYMTIVKAAEGNGLRKEYLLRIVAATQHIASADLGEALKLTLEPLQEEKRYNRNILAFINAVISQPTRAATRLTDVTDDFKMDDILTLGRNLKLSDEKLKEKSTDVKDNKSHAVTTKTTDGTQDDAVQVDVKEQVQGVKDEIINHAKELTTLSHDDLVDNILNLLVQVDDLKLDTMDINRLALIQTYLEKVVA